MAVVVVEEEAWRVLGVEVYSQLLAPISTLKSTGIPSSRSVAAKHSSGTVVAAPRARERVTLTDRHMCDGALQVWRVDIIEAKFGATYGSWR